MRQILRVIEQPRQCSYLPYETASLELRVITALGGGEYADLLARGYRRFGWQVFRPACPACSKCRTVRIRVQQFEPDAGARRILRKNENIRAELHPLFVTPEHVDLLNLYNRFMHGHRGWARRESTIDSYQDEFLSGAATLGRQWLYFDRDRLVGVALMDEAPGAISLVYCFYDPGWRATSPGTYSILIQLLYAKQSNLDYAYPGYWIEECPSMSYKNRFGPFEELREHPADGRDPVWVLSLGG